MARQRQDTEPLVYNGGIDESLAPSKIAPHKWKASRDVEPIREGCRRRPGTANVNSTAIEDIFLSNTASQGASRSFVDTVSESMAQQITTTSAVVVKSIWTRIRIETGSPTSNLRGAILQDSAGSPGASVTNFGPTDFNQLDYTLIGAEYAWHEFSMITPASLASGTYWLLFEHTGATAGNEFSLQESSGSVYSGGIIAYKSGGGWTTVSTADFNFLITTNDTAPPVNGMGFWRKSDRSATHRLVSAGGAIWSESGTSMLRKSNGRRTLFASAADDRVRIVAGQDKALITDGTDPSSVFYELSGTEYFENEGISPPTANHALALVGGGSLSNGTWEVDYYYYNSDTGVTSNLRHQGVGCPTITLGGANNTFDVTGLPAGVVREGDRATHIRIAWKGPGYTSFRYSGYQVAIGATTVTCSTAANEGALIEFDNNVPPQHSMKCVGDNRQFVSGNDDRPYRIYFSKVSGDSVSYHSFPTFNYRDIHQGDGDYVTAIAHIQPATLFVGAKNSIWAFNSRNPKVSDRVKIADGVGVASQESLVIVGQTAMFISDSDDSKGLFIWNRGELVQLAQIDNTFKTGLNLSRLKNSSCAHMAPGDNRAQWWTLVASSGAGTQDLILVYDYNLDAMAIYAIGGNVIGTIEEASEIAKVRVGRTDGFVRTTDTGTLDQGTAYTGWFQTRDENFGDPLAEKRIRRLAYDAKGAGPLGAEMIINCGQQAAVSRSLVTQVEGGSVLGTGTLGSFVLGSSGINCDTVPFRARGRVFSVEFSGDTDWELNTVNWGYQPSRRVR